MFPEWLNAAWLRFKVLFHRRQLEQDLDDETQFHLAMSEQKLVEQGMAADEAHYAALRRFGNVAAVREECREAWGIRFLNELVQDVRFGLRQLRRNPGFTIVAVLTLALGIGANTAIFSVVNAVLLRALPFENPSQIVDISSRSRLFDFPHLGLSLPEVEDIRAHTAAFKRITVYRYSAMNMTGEGVPRHLETVEVSRHVFSLLGIQPIAGRLFRQPEMEAGANHEALLSYNLWSSAFGSDPNVVGRKIELDGKPYVIVGVIPLIPKMRFLTDAALWTPLVPTQSQLVGHRFHFFHVLARLKSGHTVTQAQAELNTVAGRLAKVYPNAEKGWTFHALPLRTELFGKTRAPLLALFGAVGFLLLIACANVANLSLARGSLRQQEFAVRAALGAARRRLIRQLLIESLLVSIIGGACGLLVAFGGIYGLRGLIPGNIPRIQDLSIDWNVLWFALGVSGIAGLLAGLAPALMFSRQDLNRSMKSGSTMSVGGGDSGHQRLRQPFVISEIALAMMLVIGAGLALRSFAQLRGVDLGFEPQKLLTMRLDLPAYHFKTPQESIAFVRETIAGLGAVPGVTDTSAANFPILTGSKAEGPLEIAGASSPPGGHWPTVAENAVTPGYFQTLGIPLLMGREFTEEDNANSSKSVIVNEALARKFFGAANPIGNQVVTGTRTIGVKERATIVGVVGNVRDWNPRSVPKPTLYRDIYQSKGFSGVSLFVRTTTNSETFAPAIRDRIRSIDKDQVVSAISPVEVLVRMADAGSAFQTLLLGIFGALGLLLAVVGIYGAISYSVSQRQHEIGIRMAVGAESRDVLKMVVGQGLKLTLIGVAIGIAGALALTRFLASLLYGVKPTDPLTFIAVSLILVAVALFACYIPARRAAKVDPMVALRYE